MNRPPGLKTAADWLSSPWMRSRQASSKSSVGEPLAEFVDQHSLILGIVDRDGDQVHSACGECLLQRRYEIADRLDSSPLGAIGVGILHEIRIVEGHAEIGKVIDGLLPSDHAVGAVL